MKSLNHLIIGNGQVASHFKYYFQLLSFQFDHWYRSLTNKDHSQNLIESSADLKQDKNQELLIEKINKADFIYILISDKALFNFIQSNSALKNKICFHFSGALPSFENCISIHPLMTFSSQTYFSFDFYKSIPFITDHSGHFDFPFPNKLYNLKKEDKAMYHALCVFTGNFTQQLWAIGKEQFNKINLKPELLNPYLQQITKQIILEDKPHFSGPFVRKDFATIKSHLNALNNTPLLNIYEGFLKYYFNDESVSVIHGHNSKIAAEIN